MLRPGVPESIRQHMNRQSGAAKTLADQIGDAAAEVNEELSDQAMRARKTGVTSDDISSAMMEFLAEVKGVWKLPGGIPIAFDLVMDLARYSYGWLGDSDSGSEGYGNRPSDRVIDRLISQLAVERRRVEPSWNHVKAHESLSKQNKHLAEYGIDGFARTVSNSWQGGRSLLL